MKFAARNKLLGLHFFMNMCRYDSWNETENNLRRVAWFDDKRIWKQYTEVSWSEWRKYAAESDTRHSPYPKTHHLTEWIIQTFLDFNYCRENLMDFRILVGIMISSTEVVLASQLFGIEGSRAGDQSQLPQLTTLTLNLANAFSLNDWKGLDELLTWLLLWRVPYTLKHFPKNGY